MERQPKVALCESQGQSIRTKEGRYRSHLHRVVPQYSSSCNCSDHCGLFSEGVVVSHGVVWGLSGVCISTQCLSGFFLKPCMFCHIHNSKEFHMSMQVPTCMKNNLVLQHSSRLFEFSSCTGRHDKQLVSAYLLYVAQDFVDLYYMPLRCLFSRMKSPSQLSFSSY